MMPAINEESRQWTWVFRALWSAAPKLAEVVDQQQHFGIRRARCHLHLLVPDTILFQRGEPCKWVGSSPQGIVVRKPILQASSDGSTSTNTAGAGEVLSGFRQPDLASRIAATRQASLSSKSMDNYELFERLDAIIAAFLDFAASDRSSSSTSHVESDVPVCVARYNDGTSELLSSKSLKTLSRFFNWRASLCALQAYVRPAQGAAQTTTRTVGTYRRPRERRNKSPRYGHPRRSNENHNRSRATTASSANAAISDLKGEENLLGMVVDDCSSSSPSLQSLMTALNQAAENVAFATDLSYAWPPEPPRATPGKGHGDATSSSYIQPADVSSLGKQDIAAHGDMNLSENRMLVVLGGSVGQLPRRRPPWPKSRVQVSHLEAEFAVDQAGRLWFTNAAKVGSSTALYGRRSLEAMTSIQHAV